MGKKKWWTRRREGSDEIIDIFGRTIGYACDCGFIYWRPAGNCLCGRKK